MLFFWLGLELKCIEVIQAAEGENYLLTACTFLQTRVKVHLWLARSAPLGILLASENGDGSRINIHKSVRNDHNDNTFSV